MWAGVGDDRALSKDESVEGLADANRRWGNFSLNSPSPSSSDIDGSVRPRGPCRDEAVVKVLRQLFDIWEYAGAAEGGGGWTLGTPKIDLRVRRRFGDLPWISVSISAAARAIRGGEPALTDDDADFERV